MDDLIQVFRSAAGQAEYLAAYTESLTHWPSAYDSVQVSSPYGQTHVLICGPVHGFPLVLLHGGYASSTMWFPNVADLSAQYRVYAIDTIGEPGKSIPGRPNASRAACADWLERTLDALEIQKANVVGLSRGGWMAINLALLAPQRLEKMALLSPAASFITLTPFFQALVAGLIRLPIKPLLKKALEAWVTPGFVIDAAFARQFVLGLYHWNWQVNRRGYSGVMPCVFETHELSAIHLPVLMLLGDHDRLNPPGVIDRARQSIPHLEAAIVPQAGHMLSMEQPGEVDRRVLDFLVS